MQTVFTYLTLLFTSFVLQSQNTIEVAINGLNNDKGTLLVGLYNTEANFLEKEFKAASSVISDNKARVNFSDIPDGIYAVSCFHDEDNDGALDMFMGFIPTESYGTSRNAPSKFGPPKWEDAKFEVSNGQVVQLDIKL